MGCGRGEIGNLFPNNRRQRRTCYALCHILYPVSAAHTSIFRMDSNSTSYCGRGGACVVADGLGREVQIPWNTSPKPQTPKPNLSNPSPKAQARNAAVVSVTIKMSLSLSFALSVSIFLSFHLSLFLFLPISIYLSRSLCRSLPPPPSFSLVSLSPSLSVQVPRCVPPLALPMQGYLAHKKHPPPRTLQ